MGNYYFLGTRIPSLQLDVQPEINFSEFEILAKENLTTKDYEKIKVLRRYYDIENIRELLKDPEVDPEILDPYGNLNANELKEAWITQTGLPAYVFEFLHKYEKREVCLNHFPELLSAYFNIESENANGFLKNYLSFERDLRLVLVAFRARKLGRDLAKEMQFEDPNNILVQQMLAQQESRTFEPPEKFNVLRSIFEQYQDNPLGLYFALSEYRMSVIDEMVGFDPFSIDRILGYMVRLIIVEKWQRLNKEEGVKIVDKIVKEST